MTAEPSSLEICERLARTFYRLLDRNDMDGVLDLAWDDCQWVRAGEPQVGHEAMRKVMLARPPGVVGRHLVSNEVARQLSETEIEVGYDLLYLAAPSEAPEGSEKPVIRPKILSGTDRYRLQMGQWKLAWKRAVPEF